MSRLCSIVANALSERENHRTDTQYEDSMIAKIFIFQFVNSYASFFYLAFIAQYVGKAGWLAGLQTCFMRTVLQLS